jgi:dienelactone hydrolase
MKRRCLLLVLMLAAVGACSPNEGPPKAGAPAAVNNAPADNGGAKQTLAEARAGFKTKPQAGHVPGDPLPNPPAKLFKKTKFTAPLGQLSAYLTPDPKDGKKHPAIIWITGGDCNSVDDGIWQNSPPENDQTASAFRKAGIVMMFPSLRGGNDNPGVPEWFYGEVDDILAAADFLAKQPYVDPERIYLGGHSTGGTLVLLTGEMSNRFRAVFSFGPAGDVSGYPPQFKQFDTANRREVELRSPMHWLDSIKSPVFVLEGAQGNDIQPMKNANKNDKVKFFVVAGASHFSILAPATNLVARKILGDTGPACNIEFSAAELNKLFGR